MVLGHNPKGIHLNSFVQKNFLGDWFMYVYITIILFYHKYIYVIKKNHPAEFLKAQVDYQIVGRRNVDCVAGHNTYYFLLYVLYYYLIFALF